MKTEIDGYAQFQLWDLMSIFGPHLGNGREVSFDTEIIIGSDI